MNILHPTFMEENYITLITNLSPLTWIFAIKDPGGRLARWSLYQTNDYEIICELGKQNKTSDALSGVKINHFKCSNMPKNYFRKSKFKKKSIADSKFF